MTAHEAKRIIGNFRKKRLEMSADLLIWLGCPGIAVQQGSRSSSESLIPISEWLKSTCRTLGIMRLKSQDLEIVRRNACNRDALSEFFEKHGNFIHSRDSLL
jgi:hypothetical protein